MRGPSGSRVTLLVLSVGKSDPRTVTLSRITITPKDFEWKNEVLTTTEDGRRYIKEEEPSNKVTENIGTNAPNSQQ